MVEFFAWVILALILAPIVIIILMVPATIIAVVGGALTALAANLLDRK